jgi:Zn-finger nucleic acid-binding protein
VPLVITSLGDAKIHQCHTCGGLWLAKETFDNLAANHEIRGQAIGVLPGEKPQGKRLSSETVYYRPCPCCGKLMNRLNYARISKVIVDVCKDHGIWFDQDELRQVLAFIDSGGLVRAQERERLHLEEERSRVAMQSMGGLPAMADPDTPVLMRSDWSGVIETGSLLGKIAVGAFETLLGQFKR